MPSSTLLLLTTVVLGALPWAFGRFVRRGLAAPRLLEPPFPPDLPGTETRISTERGKTLFAWYMPANTPTPAPAVAILHGWGGNIAHMLPLARPLHWAGYAVLLVDARCHGRSDDDDFASLPRFAEDLGHAFDWLTARPEVDGRRVGVIGHSVGAAAALLVASRRPAVAAVVSLAAFAHPTRMMERWLDGKGVPRWPIGRLILAYVERTIGHRFDNIAPCNTIVRIRCPVLLLHGSDDTTVPVAEAREIYARRTHEEVQLLEVLGSHDGADDLDKAITAIQRFLDVKLAAGR